MSQSDDEKASKIAITEDSEKLDSTDLEKYIDTDKTFLARRINEYPEVYSLIFAIVGIILLGTLAQQEMGPFGPKEITLSEMENYREVKVQVIATVTDAYNPSSDFWIVDITDNSINGSAILFASSLDFIPKSGDLLDITGEVDEYKGQLEIMSDATDVKLISRSGGESATISDIANDPGYYANKVITIKSYVKTAPSSSYNTTSFTIGETYNNLRVETQNPDLLDVMIIGDYVEVTGIIKFDRYWFSYEILIEDETHKAELIV